MPARIIELDLEEIMRRYQNGESSTEIGEALNVSPNTILKTKKERKWKPDR